MENKEHKNESDNTTPTPSAAGSGAAQPPAPAAVGEPPPLLDVGHPVTPHVLITGPSEWRYLLAGVDSIDLGFYVTWGKDWPRLLQALVEGKRDAEGTEGRPWAHGKAPPLLILPRGRRMYAYQLQHPAGIIYISTKEKADGYPNVYVSMHSAALWHIGITPAINLIRDVLDDLGGVTDFIQISRVDLAADMKVKPGLSVDFLRAHEVKRSRKSAQYLDADTLETFYAGGFGAPIRMRIYDKSKEIIHSGKLWFCDLWKINDKPEDIWRVEFQLRRDALKEFQINTLQDLRERVGGIWLNLTERWFSLRRDDDENTSRRSVHPWWLAVQSLADQFGREMLVERRRKLDTVADATWYVSHAAGCLAGYAARMGISDMKRAAEAFKAEMQAYWLGKDFADRYRVLRLKLNFDDASEVQA